MGEKTPMHRNKFIYLFLIALVIAVGLASRSQWADSLPEFVANYAGDMLWSLMVFLIIGLTFPRSRTLAVAVAAIAISFAVEFSQLYQGDWLNQIRATRLGALALGAEFRWSDLTCYAFGILIGAVGEVLYFVSGKRMNSRNRIN